MRGVWGGVCELEPHGGQGGGWGGGLGAAAGGHSALPRPGSPREAGAGRRAEPAPPPQAAPRPLRGVARGQRRGGGRQRGAKLLQPEGAGRFPSRLCGGREEGPGAGGGGPRLCVCGDRPTRVGRKRVKSLAKKRQSPGSPRSQTRPRHRTEGKL